MVRLSVVENAPAATAEAALRMLTGTPHPPGATVGKGGVNFSLFSANASSVTLRLFAWHDDTAPLASFTLDGENHRTFHFWHCFIEGAAPGMFYVFHVDGPASTADGHRFDPSKALIDPYGKGISKTLWRRQDAVGPGDNLASSLRSAIIDLEGYDWEGDVHPRTPMAETVIYEMHVGGFTRHPSAGVAAPGSFQAVIDKIPYLKALGITAVELMPVFDFDNQDERRVDGRTLGHAWRTPFSHGGRRIQRRTADGRHCSWRSLPFAISGGRRFTPRRHRFAAPP